jgi:tight adherence protein C
MFLNIITICAFVVICLLVFMVGELISGSRRKKSLPGDRMYGTDSKGELRKSSVGPLTSAFGRIIPQSAEEVSKIDRDLKRAGYYRPTALVEYMATRNILLVSILITAGVLAVAADPQSSLPEFFMISGAVTACLGYGLPRLVLHMQGNRRANRIQRGLPDALDMVRMCLTGGLPLRESLSRVSGEVQFFHPDIATEFAIINRQADADTMTSALRQFARRIDTPDVNALAALVTQTDRMGTHVAAAVAEYADSVRLAWRQRAEERANKTSIKMLFPVILCLAPPIYVLLCGPPILKMRNFLIEGNQPGGVLDVSGARSLPSGSGDDTDNADNGSNAGNDNGANQGSDNNSGGGNVNIGVR